MKKIKLIFQIVFFLWPLYVFPQIDYTMEFSLNDLSMTQSLAPDQSNYTIINLNGCYSSDNTGKPDLPVMFLSFIIPVGYSIDSITYSYNDTSIYILNNLIYPTQHPFKTCAGCPQEGFVSPDTLIYNSSNKWPSTPIYASGQDYYDGNINILRIAVCPFEYYPIDDSLIFIGSIDFNVSLKSGYPNGIPGIKKLIKYQNNSEFFLLNFVDNPEDITSYYVPPTYVSSITSTSALPSYEYVIIAPSAYSSSFDDFITWKRQKGIDIGIVTLEDIESNYSGDVIFPNDAINDDAGKIRQYLYESYQDGTYWALLVGDPTILPIRYGWDVKNSIDDEHIPPTDMYFADFNGNWNVDHDACYGEPTYIQGDGDLPDFGPEIYVGRLLCSSTQDVTNWVQKLLIYEKHPGDGDSSYLIESFMFQADELQEFDKGTAASLHLPMYNHLIWEEYPSYYDLNPTFPKGADVIEEVNTTHYGLMSWFGHGGTGGQNSGVVTLSSDVNGLPQWKLDAEDAYEYHTETPEEKDGLDNLTNYQYPFVIYSISCYITPYDITKAMNNNGARNCGEGFTVNGLGGGVAFLGNTRYGLVSASSSLYNKFGDLLTLSSDQPIYSHLGYLELQSKTFSSSQHIKYTHNLIGEPETQIWTAIPDTLFVSINPSFTIVDQENSLDVSVDNLTENKQATICFYKEDEVFSTQIVIGDENSHAEATFDDIMPLTLGDIIVTVTSHNYIPSETLIPVYGCDFSETPIYIDDDETWDEDIYINSYIIVESGNTLTVQSKVYMVPDAKIIVQRGAELDIDNGIITNACDSNLWQGIEVWGTTASNQFTSGAQGKVIIENDGTIENALTAILVGRLDSISSYGGGIVQTDSAHFINNQNGVYFLPYRNIFSGQEVDNLSYFVNTEFLTDAELANEEIPDKFAHLYEVKGIGFEGCSFVNSRDQEEVDPRERGYGIYSENSDFTVTYACAQCQEKVRSVFKELNYGIFATNHASSKTFNVNNSNFYNNLTGIYLSAVNNATIIFDSIEIRNYYLFHQQGDIYGGIYIDQSTGYTIEENYLYNDNSYDPQEEIRSIGITVNNSGNNYNIIYRNQFDDLQMGILAQNQNRGTNHGTGLKLKCNICTNNQGDFAVTGNGAYLYQGISDWQGANTSGDITAPAGNIFTHDGTDPYSDFNNTLSGSWVTYFYHEGSVNDLWVPRYYQNITPTNTHIRMDYARACPSNYSGIGGGGTKSSAITMDQFDLKSRMLEMEMLRDSAIYNLSLWVDAGNTQELNEEVQTSTVPEALDIYDELIADSPYLSDSVLSTSIGKEDVLVNSMIKDIMIANPHGVKKEELREALEQRVPAIPEYMLAEILNGLDSVSVKEQKEADIAWYQQERDDAFNKLMKIYLTDTTIYAREDSLISLITNYGNLNSHYFLTNHYIELGDTVNAFLVLSNLPNQFILDSAQQSQHQDYLTIYAMLANLEQNSEILDSLDGTSRETLYQIADHESLPAAMAQNILRHIDNAVFDEVYILPTSGMNLRSIYAKANNGPDKDLELKFEIYPNPCRDYFIIDYFFKQKPDQALYFINNALGQSIDKGQLNDLQNQLIVRTSKYSSGLYNISLVINGKVEKVIKLNILR